MKTLNTLLKCVCISTTMMLSSAVFGQEGIEIIDKNPTYVLNGNGYESINGTDKIIFSRMSVEGSGSQEISLSNNEITVSKDGVYRVSLSCNLTDEELQGRQTNYSVSLNGKEAFATNYHNFPASGIYDFQIQLKKGDRLGFNIVRSDEYKNTELKSKLKVRFTDKELITYKDKH